MFVDRSLVEVDQCATIVQVELFAFLESLIIVYPFYFVARCKFGDTRSREEYFRQHLVCAGQEFIYHFVVTLPFARQDIVLEYLFVILIDYAEIILLILA